MKYALINEYGHYLRIIKMPATPPHGVIINNRVTTDWATRFESVESIERAVNLLISEGFPLSTFEKLLIAEIEPGDPKFETNFDI